MRVLAVADVEERGLWDYFTPAKVADVDVIVSAGDLDASYLEFLTTAANKPLVYVRGNHDDAYESRPPRGCMDVDGRIGVCHGLRIAGLGGSSRYRDGRNMYTERQMARRVAAVERWVRRMGGVDLVLTHAPLRGVGDLDDLPHRGFACVREFVERWSPQVVVHGHVHQSYVSGFARERMLSCGTRVVNAYGQVRLELDAPTAGSTSVGRAWRAYRLLHGDGYRESGEDAFSGAW